MNNQMMLKNEIYMSDKDPRLIAAREIAIEICPRTHFVDWLMPVQWEDGTIQFEVSESPFSPGENRTTYFLECPGSPHQVA